MSDRTDWADDDLDDDEFTDDQDVDDDEDESSETRSCPSCGADVYEDAERCPACGDYIIADTSPWSDRSWWWIALGLVGAAAVLWTSIRIGF